MKKGYNSYKVSAEAKFIWIMPNRRCGANAEAKLVWVMLSREE